MKAVASFFFENYHAIELAIATHSPVSGDLSGGSGEWRVKLSSTAYLMQTSDLVATNWHPACLMTAAGNAARNIGAGTHGSDVSGTRMRNALGTRYPVVQFRNLGGERATFERIKMCARRNRTEIVPGRAL